MGHKETLELIKQMLRDQNASTLSFGIRNTLKQDHDIGLTYERVRLITTQAQREINDTLNSGSIVALPEKVTQTVNKILEETTDEWLMSMGLRRMLQMNYGIDVPLVDVRSFIRERLGIK